MQRFPDSHYKTGISVEVNYFPDWPFKISSWRLETTVWTTENADNGMRLSLAGWGIFWLESRLESRLEPARAATNGKS